MTFPRLAAGFYIKADILTAWHITHFVISAKVDNILEEITF
jgi:hypothetical protein